MNDNPMSTRLRDKDGVEIFEGDTIEVFRPEKRSERVSESGKKSSSYFPEYRQEFLVEWNDEDTGFYPFINRMDYFYIGDLDQKYITVIKRT